MLDAHDIAEMQGKVAEVSTMLRLLGNERRLLVLCRLAIAGEMSVGDLAEAVGSQSALSQHLAKLPADDLVATRREAHALHRRIRDPARRASAGSPLWIYCAAPDRGSKS